MHMLLVCMCMQRPSPPPACRLHDAAGRPTYACIYDGGFHPGQSNSAAQKCKMTLCCRRESAPEQSAHMYCKRIHTYMFACTHTCARVHAHAHARFCMASSHFIIRSGGRARLGTRSYLSNTAARGLARLTTGVLLVHLHEYMCMYAVWTAHGVRTVTAHCRLIGAYTAMCFW